MHYNELKEVIKHIIKTVPCTQCSRRFNNEGFKVISLMNNDILFHINCGHCKNELLIHVTLTDLDQRHHGLKINTHSAKTISHNDVLDIHNFLNQFKGDFRKLFSTQKK